MTDLLHWAQLTWPEIDERRDDHIVGLVPVGATEQHGPHLPTGTDTLIAQHLCDAAATTTGALVLPAIPIGCSYGHGTKLPGTLSLAPEQLIDLVRQIAIWAAHSGIRRLLYVNAHYGNTAALLVATDHLRLERPDLQVGIVDWWRLDPAIEQELTVDGNDVHANRAETAMVMAIAPEVVRHSERNTADDLDRTGGLAFRYTATSLSRNGVTGRPSEATVELGEKLLRLTVDRLIDVVGQARYEEPPLGAADQPDEYSNRDRSAG